MSQRPKRAAKVPKRFVEAYPEYKSTASSGSEAEDLDLPQNSKAPRKTTRPRAKQTPRKSDAEWASLPDQAKSFLIAASSSTASADQLLARLEELSGIEFTPRQLTSLLHKGKLIDLAQSTVVAGKLKSACY